MPENENSKKIICLTDSDEDDRMLLHEALLGLEMPFEILELCSAHGLPDIAAKQDCTGLSEDFKRLEFCKK